MTSANANLHKAKDAKKQEYLKYMSNTAPIMGNLYYVVDGKPIAPYKRVLIRKKAGV